MIVHMRRTLTASIKGEHDGLPLEVQGVMFVIGKFKYIRARKKQVPANAVEDDIIW